MYDEPMCGAGILITVIGWAKLLGALPRVKCVQVAFKHKGGWGRGPAGFPVFRKGGALSSVKPAIERVMASAISACEQKGRVLELCGPKGWLTYEEYQGLVSRSHVIRVAEIFSGDDSLTYG